MGLWQTCFKRCQSWLPNWKSERLEEKKKYLYAGCTKISELQDLIEKSCGVRVDHFELKHEIVSVFFHGYAVKYAFESSPGWSKLSKKSVKLLACSTIADDYLSKKKKVAEGFQLAGLGQWLESIESSDKMIEFS